ncbi:hypothetical protein B566_EDAN009102 [Ephemera danica]|nr:hypothetical protein B566_EDAN009102 [Ephemera danica]
MFSHSRLIIASVKNKFNLCRSMHLTRGHERVNVGPPPVQETSNNRATPRPPASAPTNIATTPRVDSAATSSPPNSMTSSGPGSVGTMASSTSPQPPGVPAKRTPKDFIFGKVIGEGSFSMVYLAKDIHSHKEYAIKVCVKRHIIREKKAEYVKREKEVLNILGSNPKTSAPFFVKLGYFVLTYAKNGELLPYINKVGSFDLACTKFYSAEILQALEHLHSLGIIHRDLKPENILLNENMHILITDFGSAKILSPPNPVRNEDAQCKFFKVLSCIIYQMISGLTPFHAGSEYLIFQKIINLNYECPDGFSADARDLVEKLLVLDSAQRLGAQDKDGYVSIKSHPFYAGIDFDTLYCQTPPPIYPYLPGTSNHEEMRSQYRVSLVPDHLEPGLDDKQLTRLLGLELHDSSSNTNCAPVSEKIKPKNSVITDLSEEEVKQRLENQRENSKWHSFVEGNLILKQGLVDKRKGLFARRRMLLLTLGPHMYYVDPANMVLKGEIPWSPELRVEPKNFKIFFVHTVSRI